MWTLDERITLCDVENVFPCGRVSKWVVALHHPDVLDLVPELSLCVLLHIFWSCPTVPGTETLLASLQNGIILIIWLRSIVADCMSTTVLADCLPTDANLLLAAPQVRGLYPVFSDYGFISSLNCQKFC
jgi:hypothetical protein